MKHLWFLCILMLGFTAFSQDFIGSNKCGKCHKKEKQGAQLKKWEKSAHAQAFETLKSEKAVAIAKEKGLANPAHEAPECLGCHTTGYGDGGYEVKPESFYQYADDDKAAKKAAIRMKNLKAVGCESCHGAGSKYKGKKTMAAIYEGKKDGKALGLIQPDKELCLKCHNEESPTYKEFDFDARYEEIAHSFPEGYVPKAK